MSCSGDLLAVSCGVTGHLNRENIERTEIALCHERDWWASIERQDLGDVIFNPSIAVLLEQLHYVVPYLKPASVKSQSHCVIRSLSTKVLIRKTKVIRSFTYIL